MVLAIAAGRVTQLSACLARTKNPGLNLQPYKNKRWWHKTGGESESIRSRKLEASLRYMNVHLKKKKKKTDKGLCSAW